MLFFHVAQPSGSLLFMHIKHSLFPRADWVCLDGVPPLPMTAEEFSRRLQKVWDDEWVASIEFTQNPLEKNLFEAQIAVVQLKCISANWNVDTSVSYHVPHLSTLSLAAAALKCKTNTFNILNLGCLQMFWVLYSINRPNDLQTVDPSMQWGHRLDLDVREEPPLCGHERRAGSGCWVQISNSGISFQSLGLRHGAFWMSEPADSL